MRRARCGARAWIGPTSAFARLAALPWLPGEVVRVDYDVNLNPVTPAGHRIAFVIDLPQTGRAGGCGEVEIVR